MQETGNYKLKKPSGTDVVNIDDLNANSDIIDSELAKKAPSNSPTFFNNIGMGRKAETTVGENSVALGSDVIASGSYSHAEGYRTEAEGHYSHAEGQGTQAQGYSSHAEGENTVAVGSGAHVEGYMTDLGHQNLAAGPGCHAEGADSIAGKIGSYILAAHAEGYCTEALDEASHAEGSDTIASNYASHAGGKFNKTMTIGGKIGNKVGDVFVIGNGTSSKSRSNALRVTYGGEIYGLSAFQSSGADYAEYFEWLDSNTENEDRVGYFVTMEGTKIRKAQSSQDYILGIVSAQPCIVGNSDEDWLGRWQHDEFGRFLKREVKTPITEWKEVQVNSDREDKEPQFELREVKTGEYSIGWDYVPNPDYDPHKIYIERKDRKEWSAVGMMGVLAVRDDGTCKANEFCTVKEGGIATATNNTNGYRVIERVTETIVKVVFR